MFYSYRTCSMAIEQALWLKSMLYGYMTGSMAIERVLWL